MLNATEVHALINNGYTHSRMTNHFCVKWR